MSFKGRDFSNQVKLHTIALSSIGFREYSISIEKPIKIKKKIIVRLNEIRDFKIEEANG